MIVRGLNVDSTAEKTARNAEERHGCVRDGCKASYPRRTRRWTVYRGPFGTLKGSVYRESATGGVTYIHKAQRTLQRPEQPGKMHSMCIVAEFWYKI